MTSRRVLVEQLRERFRRDFLGACEHLYYIKPRDSTDLALFTLWPEQRRQAEIMLDQQRRGRPVRIVRLKTRQAGDSTLGEAWLFHQIHWNPRTHGLLVAHDEVATSWIFEIPQTIYRELPRELQHPLKKQNRRELAFEAPHSSILSTATAGWQGLGRSRTIQHIHVSEVDFFPDPVTALDGLMETCPMSPGTSVVMESTAQSAEGWLRGFWEACKRGDTFFIPLFTAWFQVPEYRLPAPPDMRLSDEEQEWVAKFAVTREQIAWYRAKRAEIMAREPWGGERKMRREYPFTDEEAFQAAGLCVFPDLVLQRLKEGLSKPVLSFRLVATGQGELIDVPMTDWQDGDLWVWESPKEGYFYSLGVDVSDGVGKTESVVSVCRYPGYEQVAEWASNTTSPEHTAWVARWLAEKYGGPSAMCIPETNKSGVLVLHILQAMPGNFSIFRWRYLDKPAIPETEFPTLGWQTNVRTKPLLAQVANMIYLRGTSEGVIRSHILHDQMKRCIDLVPGVRWRAEHGDTDRILAWMIALMGAYLEFEGGQVGGLSAERDPAEAQKDQTKRHRGEYDADWDEILAGGEVKMGSSRLPWDTLAE